MWLHNSMVSNNEMRHPKILLQNSKLIVWLALSREWGNEAIYGYDGDSFPHSLLRASQLFGRNFLFCSTYFWFVNLGNHFPKFRGKMKSKQSFDKAAKGWTQTSRRYYIWKNPTRVHYNIRPSYVSFWWRKNKTNASGAQATGATQKNTFLPAWNQGCEILPTQTFHHYIEILQN